jgi:hypothetical protein
MLGAEERKSPTEVSSTILKKSMVAKSAMEL